MRTLSLSTVTRYAARFLAPILVVLQAFPGPVLRAQDIVTTAGDMRGGWAVGASLGKLLDDARAPSGVMVGVHATQVRPGRVGADVWAGTAPQALRGFWTIAGVRLGAVYTIVVSPRVALLPGAGVTLVGGISPCCDGFVGVGTGAFVNAGSALIVGVSKSAGLRVSVTRQFLPGGEGGVVLMEMGVIRLPASMR